MVKIIALHIYKWDSENPVHLVSSVEKKKNFLQKINGEELMA